MNTHPRKNIKGNRYQEIPLSSQDFQQTSGGHRLSIKLMLIFCGSLATFLPGVTSYLAGSLVSHIFELAKDNKCQCPAFIAINFVLYFSSLFYMAAFGIELKIFFSVFSLISLGTLVITLLEKPDIIISLFFTGLGIAFGVAASLLTAYLINLNFKITSTSYYLTIGLISLNLILTSLLNLPEPLRTGTIFCDLAVIITGTIIAHKAIKGDPKFAWIKEKAIFWAATGGTSFYGLDLTDVSFENSHLPHTDFRNTILTRTSFKNVTGLELSRLQGTILEDPKVRRLLTHPQEGWKADFSHANLTGANLIKANLTLANLKEAHLNGAVLTDTLLSEANLTDANLTGANLTGAKLEGSQLNSANLINANLTGANLTGANLNSANLNGANLTNANLEGANLTKAQVLDANFSGANLTDACIKDWSINSGTIFTDITCKRVYLKEGKYGFLDPKPDTGEFQPGDFEKWIHKLNETIDIIIHQKLNWNALTVALGKTFVEQEGLDGSWSVQKTDDLYVAKVGVTPNANKQAIHQSITNYYHTEVAIQGEKTNILLNPAKEVDIMESKKEGINVGGNMTIGGDNMTLTGASIIGDLNNVTNTIQQLHDIKTEKTEDLVKILTNLKDSIANDSQLTEPQKKEALEAVQTIAEEAKKPAPERTLKYCSMALNALKGITSAVTDASKLAEVFKTCLPTLTTLLGL